MDIWKWIGFFKKKRPKQFSTKSPQDKKKQPIHRFTEIENPTSIDTLIPFLKKNSKIVRSKAIRQIQVLFSKIKGRQNYYFSLKHCSISKADFDFYEEHFTPTDFVLILKIASLNKDGYVREEAVKRLGNSQDKTALTFIIFRLADWVVPVRKIAKKALDMFLEPKFIPTIIDNLSLFQWLQQVQRADLSQIYKTVITFLVDDHYHKSIQYFSISYRDKERLILAKELSKKAPDDHLIRLYLSDRHFLIRLLALKYFDYLTVNQKNQLLQDVSPQVRRETLYYFKNDKDFKILLINYLADKSSNIRYISRFNLKEENIDFRMFYINNLHQNQQIIGSLLGLLDIEAKDCETDIQPYLEHQKINVVKTAFRVLSNLNPDLSYQFAKQHLFTNQHGLRKLIVNFLGKNHTTEIKEIIRTKYQTTDDIPLKLSILQLFSHIGNYSILPDLFIGTIDDNEYIRNDAKLFIHRWKQQAITMFERPTEKEKIRIMAVYNTVNEIHNTKKYFDINPIEGFDFYIR